MEIGHVPMKEKDRIQKEYRSLLDGIFEQLKISAREAEENNFRERVRNHQGNSQHFINNEKADLLNRIEKMRSDLKLWENNLGFLANSKQADLLKEEFEKKDAAHTPANCSPGSQNPYPRRSRRRKNTGQRNQRVKKA